MAAMTAAPNTLTITRPDDWHLHVRDGEPLHTVVPHTAAQFGRAIIMPNLRPPVTTAVQALAYKQRILAAVPEGKKVRIRVRTVNCVYVGDFLIPPMRNRVSDAINEEQRLFISLTDVLINDKDRSDFVAINKNLIESIAQL